MSPTERYFRGQALQWMSDGFEGFPFHDEDWAAVAEELYAPVMDECRSLRALLELSAHFGVDVDSEALLRGFADRLEGAFDQMVLMVKAVPT